MGAQEGKPVNSFTSGNGSDKKSPPINNNNHPSHSQYPHPPKEVKPFTPNCPSEDAIHQMQQGNFQSYQQPPPPVSMNYHQSQSYPNLLPNNSMQLPPPPYTPQQHFSQYELPGQAMIANNRASVNHQPLGSINQHFMVGDSGSLQKHDNDKLDMELMKNQTPRKMREFFVNNSLLSDAKIVVGTELKIFPVHKLFLITSSLFFKKAFIDEGKSEIQLLDFDPKIFEDVLKYCYSEAVKINIDNVLPMMEAAARFQMINLLNICKGIINTQLTADHVFKLIQKCLDFNNEAVLAKCVEFIKNNEQKCLNSHGFAEISLELLRKILQICNYDPSNFGFVIEKWTNATAKTSATINASKENSSSSASNNAPSENASMPKNSRNRNKKPPTQRQQKNKETGPDSSKSETENKSSAAGTVEDSDKSAKKKVDLDRKMISFTGKTMTSTTENSKVELFCKKSFLLHEIGFTCDFAENNTAAMISLSVIENDERKHIFTRVLKFDDNNKKTKCSRLFFKSPLKLYIGQKFLISVNFDKSVNRKYLEIEKISDQKFIKISNDKVETKSFNCISYLVVCDMPAK